MNIFTLHTTYMANYHNKNKGKKNLPPPKKTVPPVQKHVKQMQISKSSSGRLDIITAIIVAICGVLLYVNTAAHSFVLDDFSVIAENKITTGGVDSLGAIFRSGYREGNYSTEDNLYRPLTKAMFAIEYDAMGGKEYFEQQDGQPSAMHWMNILLYGALCGFIFLSLRKFFPGQYYLALIATLIFTFHPIHTEVVANIKSRDEILTLFLLLASLRCAWSYAQTNKFGWIIGTCIFYLLALFTKESAITFVALLPISLYFLTKLSWQKIGIVTSCAVVVTIIYLVQHVNVIGEIGLKQEIIPLADNSINRREDANALQRSMSGIYALIWYLKLLIIPHPLSCDYSYNTIDFVYSPGHPGFLLSLVVHTAMLVYAIVTIKKRSVIGYAIFFYFITISIVSNVFPGTLIGTNLAERLIFMPSLAFCLALAYGLCKLFKLDGTVPSDFSSVFLRKPLIWAILIPLLLLGAYKTVDRNKDWKNVSTLFNKDIKTVPNSIHMLWYHANMMTNEDSLALETPAGQLKLLQVAEKELRKSDSIYHKFPNVLNSLGKTYKQMAELYRADGKLQEATHFYNKGIQYYQENLSYNNTDPTVYNNLATCYFSLGMYDSARVNFARAIEKSQICYADGLANLGSVYGMMGAAAQANGQKEQAVIYFNKAIEQFNKTLECEPDNIQAHQFLAVTYVNLGDSIKAKPYHQKYLELKQRKEERLKNLKK